MAGLIEANYASEEDFTGSKKSDITVAKVELNIDAKVNDKVNAHTTLLYEEDETAFSVDAAYIDVAIGPVNTLVGAMGAPFGSFATHMLTDPLTMQLAETAESMLQLRTRMGPIQAAVYAFNGTIQKTGADDVADEMGVRLAYLMEGNGTKLDFGIDYINNIADSDKIGDYLTDPNGPYHSKSIKAYVPAQIYHANLSVGSLHFITEHLVADQFDAAEIAFNAKGAKITATNLELALDMNIAGMDSTLGVAVQSMQEALALGMPKEKTMAVISLAVARSMTLGFEYANSTDYAIADGGTGKTVNAFTVQLAVGF
jgi:hypothetical protein